jgi:hypothetical protein
MSDRHHEPRLDDGREILDVSELRRILADVDGSKHVVIATPDWYVNVGEVVVPDPDWEHAEHSAVTLYPGTPLDTRQF